MGAMATAEAHRQEACRKRREFRHSAATRGRFVPPSSPFQRPSITFCSVAANGKQVGGGLSPHNHTLII
jgi:hypothetical protein